MGYKAVLSSLGRILSNMFTFKDVEETYIMILMCFCYVFFFFDKQKETQ